jgi:hypothetical protein
MMRSVYIETTIPSYLAAWQSPQIVMAARQQITHDWWNHHRKNFELFISQIVLDEASGGDPEASAKRLEILRDIDVLEPPADVDEIVETLLKEAALPENALNEALHVAIAIGNGMDYLLTWNCRHIANATLHDRMASACEALGLELPVICTPEQLIEI